MAFPILGVLFLVSVTMGLLSKAAPQMNLMSEGFPLSIGVAFVIMVACIPFLMEAFSRLIENAFGLIDSLFSAGAAA
jgi:flagellar biosynthetic protein FliR